jgi:L-asparaginase II
MMKKLLVLAFSFAIGTAAYAAPAKAASAKLAHLSGTVEKYDTGSKELTVKHDGKSTTFEVSDKAEVMKGKAKADVSALAASSGQAVKVQYMMSGASRIADKVEVSADHAQTATKVKSKK